MPSLKAIRRRITSVKNTQKITKAMKLVAAARLRKAQQRAQDLLQRLGPGEQEALTQLAAEAP